MLDLPLRRRLSGGCRRGRWPPLEQANDEREEGVSQKRGDGGRLARDGRRAEEDVDLDAEHDETEDEGGDPTAGASLEVEPHAAEQQRRLEAKRGRRHVPQSEPHLGGIVVER